MDANVDEWITQSLNSVGIIANEYLPIMGGLLVHVKQEGIIWIPRSRVAGILSKSGLLDTIARHGQIAFTAIGFIFAPIATAYSQFIRRGLRIPPNAVTSFSKSIIERVLLTRPTLYQKAAKAIVGVKDKLVSVVKREIDEKEGEEVNYYALRIIVTLEEIKINELADSSFISKIENAIVSRLEEEESLPETLETFEPSETPEPYAETEIKLTDEEEEDEPTGKLKKLSKVKSKAVGKLKNAGSVAKEKLQDTGTVAKEKLVDVGSYVGDKISKVDVRKVARWIQGYPLFRVRLTESESEKLHTFLKSLQEDGIEVNSALELEDELLAEFDIES
ncbi:MAG: hypothetical protein ACW963_02965 [Candidatus Sifarchaeia archaeon]|jgi:hypothetical protein